MNAAKPSAILYRMSRLQYALGKRLVNIRYMTLVNLLAMDDRFEPTNTPYDPAQPGAERVPMPEYPTYEDRSDQLAAHVLEWTGDDRAYRRAQARLEQLRAKFSQTGASARAADYILETLGALPARRAA